MGGGGSNDLKAEHLLIILPFPEPHSIIHKLRQRHPSLEITYHQSPSSQSSSTSASDAIKDLPASVFRSATILATFHALPSHPSDAPKLHLVHFCTAGIDHVVHHPIYTHTDITLTTSSGIHGPQIAEWVLLTALAFDHQFPLLLDWQREKRWGGLSGLGAVRDMVGRRVGVLGYGAIGRQVARVCKAMGMDVIAYTATAKTTPESRRDHGYIVPGTGDPDGSIPSEWYSGLEKAHLHHFLQQNVDHLVISVPLTPETTGLLGREEFEKLGHGFVSNISRGKVVVQDDLIEALKRGLEEDENEDENGDEDERQPNQKEKQKRWWIDGDTTTTTMTTKTKKGLRGAALDVTDPEPLPDTNDLWTLSNVFISPHVSGAGVDYLERAMDVLDVNLIRMEKGERLINVVDRKRGY